MKMLAMGRFATRLDLARAYFDARRNFPFSFFEMVSGMVKPTCSYYGPRYISKITETTDFLVVQLRGVDTPLYWPRTLPLFDLYKVITECFYEHDWHFYEVPETRVADGDIVLDCGAAEGIFALRVLSRARQVVIFEPLPVFMPGLRRTFDSSLKATIVPSALGSAPCQAFFEGGSLYARITDQQTDLAVQVTTIDDWCDKSGSRVDFIKGDLESFELEVLKGASQTIKTYKPKIAFTVYHPGNDWQQILAFVHSLVPEYRYRVKGLSFNGNQVRPVMIHLWCDPI